MNRPAGAEPALDPNRPIIDPHLHFWDIRAAPGLPQEPQRFLLDEAAALVHAAGHRITHSVFVECHAMYRADGPETLRSLGETEFANGIAAMSASGGYGPTRFAHRIVGSVDLTRGADLPALLDRHRAAAGPRFCGVRMNTAYNPIGLFGAGCDPALRDLIGSAAFRDGARQLAASGLSLDLWCMAAQLPDVIALADAVPDLVIVLDHAGTPGRDAEAMAVWAADMARLADRPNLRVKLGGLGMDISAPISARMGTATSVDLASRWGPVVERCVALFGADRCMFESNYPPDQAAASYGTIWNAFKRLSAGCSDEERDRLFRRTAADTYRIDLG